MGRSRSRSSSRSKHSKSSKHSKKRSRSRSRSRDRERSKKRSKSREAKRNRRRESRSRSRSTTASSRRDRAASPPERIDIFGRTLSKRNALDEKQRKEEEERRAEMERQRKMYVLSAPQSPAMQPYITCPNRAAASWLGYARLGYATLSSFKSIGGISALHQRANANGLTVEVC